MAFIIVAALLFLGSAAGTIVWCASMSSMGGMPMPGGWTMSMAWMRMGEETWLEAAASFVGMWVVMMVAMKLPSLVPLLWRERRRFGARVLIIGLAYFAVWTALGIVAYPIGVGFAAIEMRSSSLSRAVPIAAGAVIVIAGALQLTRWKMRQLAEYRARPDGESAWRYGLRLGLRCARSCAGLMAILFVVGVMDLGAMAIVAAAITLERLIPSRTAARAVGAVAVVAGLVLIARAA